MLSRNGKDVELTIHTCAGGLPGHSQVYSIFSIFEQLRSYLIMLKPVTSLFLAVLILVSSTGVSGQVHDCRVKGRLVGLYGSAVSCCSILKIKPKRALGTCCKLKKTRITTVRRVPCCQDRVHYQHLDIQQIVKQEIVAASGPTKISTLPSSVEMLLTGQADANETSITPRAHPPPCLWDPQARFCQYRC